MIGITVKENIGIGDKIQFSSLPENYFKTTGEKLVDVSKCWIFDHNPYVLRGDFQLEKTVEMWNFSPRQWPWPRPRKEQTTYLCQAEIFASVLNVDVNLNRPRLYFNEDYPYKKRHKIIIQTMGRSHGVLPEEITKHVVEKYGQSGDLYQISLGDSHTISGVPSISTPDLWTLVKEISECKMFIGPDSGPSWISACYPDIVTKIVRTRPTPGVLKTWTPLEIDNVHSHWDDRARLIHNTTKEDIGFTSSYLRL